MDLAGTVVLLPSPEIIQVNHLILVHHDHPAMLVDIYYIVTLYIFNCSLSSRNEVATRRSDCKFRFLLL